MRVVAHFGPGLPLEVWASMLRSSTTLLLSVLGLALAGSTIACSGKTADDSDTNAALQAVKKKDGQPTGNGKTCSWSGVTNVDPPVATTPPSGGSSGGCDTDANGTYHCWSYDANGQPTDLPTKDGSSSGWSGSSSSGGSSSGSIGSSSGGCTVDDKGNQSCWTDPSPPVDPTPPVTPTPETYQIGDWFPAQDGCNKCTCTDIGIMCTVQACAVPPVEPPVMPPPPSNGCTVDGKWLKSGTRFTASDNCNTCTCGPDGQVACTEMGCVEPEPPVQPPQPKK